jgi:biotin operon repressor
MVAAMSADPDLGTFIRDQFRSVWALELLLFLKSNPAAWSGEQLVTTLRASEAIVANSLAMLLAGGLIVRGDDGRASYAPASAHLEQLITETEALYARKPDAVRRLIVSSSTGGLSAFADAFRLRRD